MKTRLSTVVVVLSVLLAVSAAVQGQCGWQEGDPHKMHYAQTPKSGGWDVEFDINQLGDDFRCTESGPITDIHFWVSWKQNNYPGPNNIYPFTVSIYSDIPAGQAADYSMPGQQLWTRTFSPGEYEICDQPLDEQGWLDPTSWEYNLIDHNIWQQISITNIADPFIQEEGTIYWLVISFMDQPFVGWKEADKNFNDTAVVYFAGMWIPIYDPIHETNLDLAFVITNDGATDEMDYGDAPDGPYPTLSANNGACHVIVPGVYMGSLIDSEFDGQPNGSATGDDLAFLPDEDGVFFTSPMLPGQIATVDVIVSIDGFLSAWIDFDGSGDWAGAGEMIFSMIPVTAGLNNLTFAVPASTPMGLQTFARFRFTTGSVIMSYTGLVADGEVEDYGIVIEVPEPIYDFGDAPDPSYPTLLASNGARHIAVASIALGNIIDIEPDGQPSPGALGDDFSGLYDEDGVTFATPFTPGMMAAINVTASAPGYLSAWIDYNGNGSWADAGEKIFTSYPLNAGTSLLTTLVPSTATVGLQTYARFRFTTNKSIISYDGELADGEVEDYMVVIEDFEPGYDLGDAPDSTNNFGTTMTAYPVGTQANFPSTYIGSGLSPYGPLHLASTVTLGPLVSAESEADFGPDADIVNNIDPMANIADLDGADDGVAVPLNLPKCRFVTFDYTVNVGVGAPDCIWYVNAWFDWNRDGDWDDKIPCRRGVANEWAVRNQLLFSLQPGLNTITSLPVLPWHPSNPDLPRDIWMRITIAQTPWTDGSNPGMVGNGGSGPVGGYADGETEDYYFEPDTSCSECADLNCDDIVNLFDFATLAAQWLSTCP